jgi:AcrR family transcriptional regulator
MTSDRHIDTGSAAADDRYLDAARDVILDVGWSRATLTDVARRAGVSRMTLYRRWPDTRTLLADLMTRQWHGVVREVVGDGTDLPTDAAGIAAVVVRVATGLRADPLLRRVVELDPEALLPYLVERRGRGQQQLADVVAGLVRAGQEAGDVRRGDPDLMARTLLLALQGPVLAAYDDDLAAVDAELEVLVRGHLSP